MPTYEYRCAKGHTFDVFQKMSDEPVATCPECGAEAERVISAGAGFLFKGEGFYITDYRSEEYKKKKSAESKKKEGAKEGGGGTGSKAGDGGAASGKSSPGGSTGGGSSAGSSGDSSGSAG